MQRDDVHPGTQRNRWIIAHYRRTFSRTNERPLPEESDAEPKFLPSGTFFAVFFSRREVVDHPIAERRLCSSPPPTSASRELDVAVGIVGSLDQLLVAVDVPAMHLVPVPQMTHRRCRGAKLSTHNHIGATCPSQEVRPIRSARANDAFHAVVVHTSSKRVCHQVVSTPRNTDVVQAN